MLNRYVCAGIVLLAFGGTVVAETSAGAMTSISDTQITFKKDKSDNVQDPMREGGTKGEPSIKYNKNTVKVVKLVPKSDALTLGQMEKFKSPLRGKTSSVAELRKVITTNGRTQNPPLGVFIQDAKGNTTEIGYFDVTEPVTVQCKIIKADNTEVVIDTGRKTPANTPLKVSGTKVLKQVGSAKPAPSTITDLQNEIKRGNPVDSGSVPGSVTFKPATKVAISISFKVPETIIKNINLNAAPKAAPKKP
jgi:hypothetical protein